MGRKRIVIEVEGDFPVRRERVAVNRLTVDLHPWQFVGDVVKVEDVLPEKRIDFDTPHGKLTVICDPSMPPDIIALVERRLCPEQTRYRQSACHLRFSSAWTMKSTSS